VLGNQLTLVNEEVGITAENEGYWIFNSCEKRSYFSKKFGFLKPDGSYWMM
jgi:hypothetical protein